MVHRTSAIATLLALMVVAGAGAQSREDKVRNDRKKVEAEGFWIYNDMPRAWAEARKSGKPILAVLRCIPCEECVKLDDDLINQDPRVRPLMDQFVCVRVVSTNGLDLSLFQFDTDQSFAAFFLNADGTIYGRFGTRSHRTYWSDDVSVEGLANAMRGALDLHKAYPNNKDMLAAKRGPTPDVPSPEKYPALSGKYTAKLNYEGKVVPSCIHCHQIGDAQKEMYRKRGEAIPEHVLFPYPHPKSIGLILDPKDRATVVRTEEQSPASKAGFKPGDRIERLAGQPLLSIADVQWVLHRASGKSESIKAQVRRGDDTVELTLSLADGWKRGSDISWRASTWGLRRMALGGMVLEPLPPGDRKKAGLSETEPALRVKHVGQYGAHAAAKNAGFQQGDVIVSFDGKSEFATETALITYATGEKKPGDKVEVMVIRGGKKRTLMLPMQD